jgi:hypothetical protein
MAQNPGQQQGGMNARQVPQGFAQPGQEGPTAMKRLATVFSLKVVAWY